MGDGQSGNDYETDGVEIKGEEYYVYYMRYVPMTERFWEWLLPENGRA